MLNIPQSEFQVSSLPKITWICKAAHFKNWLMSSKLTCMPNISRCKISSGLWKFMSVLVGRTVDIIYTYLDQYSAVNFFACVYMYDAASLYLIFSSSSSDFQKHMCSTWHSQMFKFKSDALIFRIVVEGDWSQMDVNFLGNNQRESSKWKPPTRNKIST